MRVVTMSSILKWVEHKVPIYMEITAIYIDIWNLCSEGSDNGAVRTTALLALVSDPPRPLLCCLGGQSMTRTTMVFSNLSPAGPDRNTWVANVSIVARSKLWEVSPSQPYSQAPSPDLVTIACANSNTVKYDFNLGPNWYHIVRNTRGCALIG